MTDDILKVECCLIDKGFDIFYDESERKHYFKCRTCDKPYIIRV